MKKQLKTVSKLLPVPEDKAEKLKPRYIPFRFIIVVFLIVFGALCSAFVVLLLCRFLKLYAVIPVVVVYLLCVLHIIRSDDNPDYKIPWLILIFVMPVLGIILYLTLYSRRLPKSQQRLFDEARSRQSFKDDSKELAELKDIDPLAYGRVTQLCAQSGVHLYKNTKIDYFPLGEDMYVSMLRDLKNAEKFIFMEYFIIERGVFWDRILNILKEKAASGVNVSVIYDDVGCMRTLPGNYYKQLRKLNINAVPFSIFRATSDGEFNNRNHRKITVIDGKIGYTGGINIADEYINVKRRFGHWKDSGVRLEGEAVCELMRMFAIDYAMNAGSKIKRDFSGFTVGEGDYGDDGFIVPFGDGPVPVYRENVAKNAFCTILNQAEKYVYITTPYLIIDNELQNALCNAAGRGVDVKIITPHVPDKKIIHFMTRSYYRRLIKGGVKIYEYLPGFIHSKIILSDDSTGIIGTINFDYRSLVHHFENGVWFYKSSAVGAVKADFEATLKRSGEVGPEKLKNNFFRNFVEAVIRIFAPML